MAHGRFDRSASSTLSARTLQLIQALGRSTMSLQSALQAFGVDAIKAAVDRSFVSLRGAKGKRRSLPEALASDRHTILILN